MPIFGFILARKSNVVGYFYRSQKVSGLKWDEMAVRTVDLPYFVIFYGLLYRLCETFLLGQSISVAAISFHLRSKDSITTVYLRYLTAYLQTITGYSSSVPVRCSTKQVKMEQFTNSKHFSPLTEIQK